jgi:hypothetical protein
VTYCNDYFLANEDCILLSLSCDMTRLDSHLECILVACRMPSAPLGVSTGTIRRCACRYETEKVTIELRSFLEPEA